MLRLRPLLSAALAASLGAALPACLLDAGPYEGAPGDTGGTTGGTGTSTTHSGGTGGDGASGGTSTGGGGAGATGGTGGAGATGGTGGDIVVPGDACPGKSDSIAVYAHLLIDQGDTTLAKDDYGSSVCGGGDAPDVVHAITALGKGILTVTIEPDSAFAGFLHVRTACGDPATEKDCGATVTVPVEKDQVVYVIADGHTADPGGLASAGKYKLQVDLDGCGNGTIEDGQEECDDGNTEPNDTCDKCKVRCTKDGSISTNADVFIHPATYHCYMQSYDPNSDWQTAANDCTAWGGYLAVLATQQEIDDLSGLRQSSGEDIWIGGTDAQTDGTFVWVDGEPWSYTSGSQPWDDPFAGPSEPNGGNSENCVEIYKGGTLNDEHCNVTQNWLCERPPAGNPPAQ